MVRQTGLEKKQKKLIEAWKKSAKPKPKRKSVKKPAIKFPSTLSLRDKTYAEFLVSDYWYKVRRLVLRRDRKQCTKCTSKDSLHVHHLTYQNHFNEHLYLSDLITVCDPCHKRLHGIE